MPKLGLMALRAADVAAVLQAPRHSRQLRKDCELGCELLDVANGLTCPLR